MFNSKRDRKRCCIWQEAKNRTLQETHLRNYIKEMEDYDSALFKGH